MQDSAARQALRQMDEEPELGDHEAIAEGREALKRPVLSRLMNGDMTSGCRVW
jgi:hypothetical protein